MSGANPLCMTFPRGFYLGFNAAIDRKSAEQLAVVVADAGDQ